MKGLLRHIVVVSFILGIAGIAFADNPGPELDLLVEEWTESLLNEDIDDFLGCYWDDAQSGRSDQFRTTGLPIHESDLR
jgi:hypothetical protein